MKNCIYRVVSEETGVKEYNSVPELLTTYKQRGIAGRRELREELQGQPMLDGLLGPMYDGEKNEKTVIRYETRKMYAILSI